VILPARGRIVLLEKANVKRSGAISMGMDRLNTAGFVELDPAQLPARFSTST
jgi:hypothetical protein